MLEKQIEQKLVAAVKAKGGIALKLASTGWVGIPDRIVLLPQGNIAFVEVKAPGKKPRHIQISRHVFLQRIGFKVYVLDDAEKIDRVLDEIGGDAL